jgi:hypothetical protein
MTQPLKVQTCDGVRFLPVALRKILPSEVSSFMGVGKRATKECGVVTQPALHVFLIRHHGRFSLSHAALWRAVEDSNSWAIVKE